MDIFGKIIGIVMIVIVIVAIAVIAPSLKKMNSLNSGFETETKVVSNEVAVKWLSPSAIMTRESKR